MGSVGRSLILWVISRFLLFVLKVLLERSFHHLYWNIFIESLSIHTRGSLYLFFEGAELLRLFFLNFHQISILIFQLLVLSQQLSIFLTEILDFSLVDFHGSFEEIHLLFHDTVEKGDIFIAFHHLPRRMRLSERSTRWRWSCSDAHLCSWGMMCWEKSTVVIFCEILQLIFGIQ